MFFLIFLAVAVKKVFILIFTTPDGLLVEFRNSRLSSRFSLLLKTDGFYSKNRWIFPQYYQSRRRKSKHQRIDGGNEVRIQKLRAWNYFSSASFIFIFNRVLYFGWRLRGWGESSVANKDFESSYELSIYTKRILELDW